MSRSFKVDLRLRVALGACNPALLSDGYPVQRSGPHSMRWADLQARAFALLLRIIAQCLTHYTFRITPEKRQLFAHALISSLAASHDHTCRDWLGRVWQKMVTKYPAVMATEAERVHWLPLIGFLRHLTPPPVVTHPAATPAIADGTASPPENDVSHDSADVDASINSMTMQTFAEFLQSSSPHDALLLKMTSNLLRMTGPLTPTVLTALQEFIKAEVVETTDSITKYDIAVPSWQIHSLKQAISCLTQHVQSTAKAWASASSPAALRGIVRFQSDQDTEVTQILADYAHGYLTSFAHYLKSYQMEAESAARKANELKRQQQSLSLSSCNERNSASKRRRTSHGDRVASAHTPAENRSGSASPIASTASAGSPTDCNPQSPQPTRLASESPISSPSSLSGDITHQPPRETPGTTYHGKEHDASDANPKSAFSVDVLQKALSLPDAIIHFLSILSKDMAAVGMHDKPHAKSSRHGVPMIAIAPSMAKASCALASFLVDACAGIVNVQYGFSTHDWYQSCPPSLLNSCMDLLVNTTRLSHEVRTAALSSNLIFWLIRTMQILRHPAYQKLHSSLPDEATVLQRLNYKIYKLLRYLFHEEHPLVVEQYFALNKDIQEDYVACLKKDAMHVITSITRCGCLNVSGDDGSLKSRSHAKITPAENDHRGRSDHRLPADTNGQPAVSLDHLVSSANSAKCSGNPHLSSDVLEVPISHQGPEAESILHLLSTASRIKEWNAFFMDKPFLVFMCEPSNLLRAAQHLIMVQQPRMLLGIFQSMRHLMNHSNIRAYARDETAILAMVIALLDSQLSTLVLAVENVAGLKMPSSQTMSSPTMMAIQASSFAFDLISTHLAFDEKALDALAGAQYHGMPLIASLLSYFEDIQGPEILMTSMFQSTMAMMRSSLFQQQLLNPAAIHAYLIFSFRLPDASRQIAIRALLSLFRQPTHALHLMQHMCLPALLHSASLVHTAHLSALGDSNSAIFQFILGLLEEGAREMAPHFERFFTMALSALEKDDEKTKEVTHTTDISPASLLSPSLQDAEAEMRPLTPARVHTERMCITLLLLRPVANIRLLSNDNIDSSDPATRAMSQNFEVYLAWLQDVLNTPTQDVQLPSGKRLDAFPGDWYPSPIQSWALARNKWALVTQAVFKAILQTPVVRVLHPSYAISHLRGRVIRVEAMLTSYTRCDNPFHLPALRHMAEHLPLSDVSRHSDVSADLADQSPTSALISESSDAIEDDNRELDQEPFKSQTSLMPRKHELLDSEMVPFHLADATALDPPISRTYRALFPQWNVGTFMIRRGHLADSCSMLHALLMEPFIESANQAITLHSVSSACFHLFIHWVSADPRWRVLKSHIWTAQPTTRAMIKQWNPAQIADATHPHPAAQVPLSLELIIQLLQFADKFIITALLDDVFRWLEHVLANCRLSSLEIGHLMQWMSAGSSGPEQEISGAQIVTHYAASLQRRASLGHHLGGLRKEVTNASRTQDYAGFFQRKCITAWLWSLSTKTQDQTSVATMGEAEQLRLFESYNQLA
ncbi:hypothetical protein CXG81DRAFT_18318 [Caulochytrium protostelioides]|nr:hypothetical protein CXG81DRAFT_18318 [Caulochytrium protostelioides]|eukprot:RKP01960.1 hypothetical protein CXG81DRAFT_18318 [Caulochytrium protostelioides]